MGCSFNRAVSSGRFDDKALLYNGLESAVWLSEAVLKERFGLTRRELAVTRLLARGKRFDGYEGGYFENWRRGLGANLALLRSL
jgi:hypothetical protein